ncbi:putative sporulation protein YtxC [Clostridium sp. P21]|uniref:Putative sporulation protein YtxC n=1 Tax=Clostridium muellerianum TaxID=2716538 RepID=A0A7Y0EIE9_9CLOT|nr:putative sporulation protein YtxC [Clostridium muellerianum]NMM64048.1 putative sporulation protein YtxC [Clostridium muellerianum]
MLLLTVVYDNDKENVIDRINKIKEYFKNKNIVIGISESIESNTHFVKIFCDEELNDKLNSMFTINIANILYEIVIDEFYKRDMEMFLYDTYFFLKYDEIKEIKESSLKVLKGKEATIDENSIYYMNKKNIIIDKIVECIHENKEININGFITFRMKELKEDLEQIIDKVVEKYMAEKEYTEFIKLLKYFVEIQDSKIEEINIIIKNDGKYSIQDREGNNIEEKLFSDLEELKYSDNTNIDDMIISVLITNSPEKIVIHCSENCKNLDLIDTIKKVFTDRVQLCDTCKVCKEIKHSLNKV